MNTRFTAMSAALAGSALLALLGAVSVSLAAPLSASAEEPASVLKRYINLRLAMADRTVYSQLITWPDEPPSECYWVTSHFKLEEPRPGTDDVVVPATYDRLGRYCPEFDLQLFDESERIEYHLILADGKWKVAGPAPDYPDVEIQTLLRRLANAAQSPGQSPEQRRRLDEVIRALRATLRAHPRVMRPR
jgi:hypothetical protein